MRVGGIGNLGSAGPADVFFGPLHCENVSHSDPSVCSIPLLLTLKELRLNGSPYCSCVFTAAAATLHR